jgi:enamine deaminase RidA (YjgF/YER057c/UK114 family)
MKEKIMSRKSIYPDTLFPSKDFGFAQVVVSEGSKYIHCAGQTAWDKDLQIVGAGDLAKQMEKAMDNVRLALEAASATLNDIVNLRIYVVDYSPEYVEIITSVLNNFFDEDNLPANTLLGIQSLAVPEFMVEIEATAVI